MRILALYFKELRPIEVLVLIFESAIYTNIGIFANNDIKDLNVLELIRGRRIQGPIPAVSLAERSVFAISIVIVMGPTPPGTGVIAFATSMASS